MHTSIAVPEHEKFLYYLSALGKIERSAFLQWFGETCIHSENKEEINQAYFFKYIYILESLGHIESINREIYICPPLLSMLRRGSQSLALLTGARDSFLIECLDSAIKANFPNSEMICVHQSQRIHNTDVLYPNSYFIKNINPGQLKKLAQIIDISFQKETAPKQILDFSDSIEKIKSGLDWCKYLKEEPRGLINRVFSSDKLQFTQNNHSRLGYHLVEYKHNAYTYEYWIWNDEGKGAITSRDWGRYLVLNANRMNILIYEENAKALAVPANLRLPIILSRAATSCSGLIPKDLVSSNLGDIGLQIDKMHFTVYYNIPKDFAEEIANKLGQELLTLNAIIKPDICSL